MLIRLYLCFGNLILMSPSLYVNRYGDRSPRSVPARIFGIMWTLTGLVIISILIGAIASSLTSVTVEQSIMLYGAKVGTHEGRESNFSNTLLGAWPGVALVWRI